LQRLTENILEREKIGDAPHRLRHEVHRHRGSAEQTERDVFDVVDGPVVFQHKRSQPDEKIELEHQHERQHGRGDKLQKRGERQEIGKINERIHEQRRQKLDRHADHPAGRGMGELEKINVQRPQEIHRQLPAQNALRKPHGGKRVNEHVDERHRGVIPDHLRQRVSPDHVGPGVSVDSLEQHRVDDQHNRKTDQRQGERRAILKKHAHVHFKRLEKGFQA